MINDFKEGNITISKKGDNQLLEIAYAFNKKKGGFNVEEIAPKKETAGISGDGLNQLENVPSEEALDYNKFWQVYFDPTYNRNYYYNPFLNQSVWDLPEGGAVAENQQPQYYMQEADAQTTNVQEEAVQEQQEDYYDEEAWDENDLREKLIWDKLKTTQLKDWMKRAARQQVTDTRRDTAYIEGNYDYNIWYDKYLTDRKEEREKLPAMHKCNPQLDTGFTKADLQEKEGGAYFCLYFAKGCCSEGVNCKYYHRVPTIEDAEKIENLRDVFGRSRFANPRNDMGGVGTFTRECRTLFVSDLKMVESQNPMKEMVRIIYENFSPWGEVEDINYIATKGTCFIRYEHRCFAEFAKEAMVDQSLVGEEIIRVKWAYDDPNPMSKKRMDIEQENRFLSAHAKKNENMKKIREKHNNKPLPNTDYQKYYNNINNPYAYSSGYGQEVSSLNQGNDSAQQQQMINNCVKLAETFKMLGDNFGDNSNI